MAFTPEELSRMSKSDLMNLCKFYDIPHKKRWRKEELSDALIKFCGIEEKEESVQMSVRIRRIRNSTKGV